MLQPTPTLPIPGTTPNLKYTLTAGIGGLASFSLTLPPPTNYGSSAYEYLDYSNLIAQYSDTTSKPGTVIVTSTSYLDSKIAFVNAPYTDVFPGPQGGSHYDFPNLYGTYQLIDKTGYVLGVQIGYGGNGQGTVDLNVYIYLYTLTLEYPNGYSSEELFEDLKDLPSTVTKELEKVDCKIMQSALGLLNLFRC